MGASWKNLRPGIERGDIFLVLKGNSVVHNTWKGMGNHFKKFVHCLRQENKLLHPLFTRFSCKEDSL